MSRFRAVALAGALAVAAAAPAAEVLRTLRSVSWQRLLREGKLAGLKNARVLGPNARAEFEQLEIRPPAAPAEPTLTLATIDRPGVSADRYAVIGNICCEDVRGEMHLEMWSHLADGQRASVRAVFDGEGGGALRGSASWQTFRLVARRDQGAAPTRLVVNLIARGTGTLWLSPLRLVEYKDDPRIPDRAAPGGWWSARAAGWLGGIGGALLAGLCALAAALMAKGAPRPAVQGVLAGTGALGAAGLIAGIVAVCAAEPFAVWFVLVLGGVAYAAFAAVGLALARRLCLGP